MKTLVILAIILAIFSAYFVLNTEKSLSIRNANGVMPAGIDIAKSILNQANGILHSGLAGGITSKIGEVKDKVLDEAINLIKTPIKNKVQELLCPVK